MGLNREYEVIIVGGGPAGLTAGVYSSRAGLKTLLLEGEAVGGQILKTDIVENYPGFPDGISGFELVEKIQRQAERFGVELIMAEAVGLTAHSPRRITIRVKTGEEYLAKAAIIATGASPKRLGIKGEKEFCGRGVSYCATCDGPLFKGKDIVVIGGGDTAVGEAIYLTRFVNRLSLIHRRESLRASKILQDRLLGNKKVGVKWGCIATEILGRDRVAGVKIKGVKTGREEEIPTSGVFVYVGLEPNTEFVKGLLELDEKGFIITDKDMMTSLRGIFACGDATHNVLKQLVTACSEGAQAAYSCWHYIEGL